MQQQLKKVLRRAASKARSLYLSVGSGRQCPICGWTGRAFLRRSISNKPADTYVCPSCGSSERHRFAYDVLKEGLAANAVKTLHCAPEKCIEPWLRSISKEYLSVDLSSASAMVNMDITDLQLPNEAFSLLWCSHVLEHIEDDRKAMAEIFRVLRPSGLAVIMVPIYGEKTYEDPKIVSAEGRLKYFKQEDHVRLYGIDIKERLAEVGFSVQVVRISDVPVEYVEMHVLAYPSTKEIFLCTKP